MEREEDEGGRELLLSRNYYPLYRLIIAINCSRIKKQPTQIFRISTEFRRSKLNPDLISWLQFYHDMMSFITNILSIYTFLYSQITKLKYSFISVNKATLVKYYKNENINSTLKFLALIWMIHTYNGNYFKYNYLNTL